ncbi:hypothetical protein, partial [Yersinia pseudotuberculosis]
PKLKALLNPQPSWGFSGHKKTEVSNNFGFAYPASSFSRLPDKTHKAGFPLVLAKSINALYF